MNSVIVLVSALTVFTLGVSALNKATVKEAAIQIIRQCKEQEGASDSDIDALRQKKMPKSHEGMCMMGCIFESGRIMKDGKFDKDGMIEALTPHLSDNAKLEKLKNLAATCEKEIGEGGKDKCDNAKLLVDCMIKHAPSHGIELPDGISDRK